MDAQNDNFKITEVELVYRNRLPRAERPIVKRAKEAYDLLINSWDMNKIELQEQFRVIFLERNGRVLGISTPATGGIANCLVDLKIVFATALKARASTIILAHNHPSGSITPSEADKQLTSHFFEVGRRLDLKVLDHLIVTKEGYSSFADEGLMPTAT